MAAAGVPNRAAADGRDGGLGQKADRAAGGGGYAAPASGRDPGSPARPRDDPARDGRPHRGAVGGADAGRGPAMSKNDWNVSGTPATLQGFPPPAPHPLAPRPAIAHDRRMDIAIHTAWTPGAIGGIAALHARTYAQTHGFGAFFEAKVARELGDFLLRLDPARDLFRCAVADDRVLGSIALDCGEDPAGAHLRWFIVDPALRGRGLGRRWLDEAIAQARRVAMPEIRLWTLSGLDAAAHLYAAAGFVLDREVTARQWGRTVAERRLVLPLIPRC